MKTNVTGRHVDVTSAMRDYAQEKVSKLDKYLPEGADASIVLGVEKYRHRADILIKVNGILIQAQEETDEMYSSIDKAVDKLTRRCRRYKEKLKDKKGRGAEKAPMSEEPATPEERVPEVIKIKRFDMKPMTTDEAVMQMELLDKVFFVFANIGTGSLNVIYKRKDGNVGLIEPAVS
jgi:putative sigma-54 modulation protein